MRQQPAKGRLQLPWLCLEAAPNMGVDARGPIGARRQGRGGRKPGYAPRRSRWTRRTSAKCRHLARRQLHQLPGSKRVHQL